jgi:3',5'-cyclic AMP phosphodiesterase CpdA
LTAFRLAHLSDPHLPPPPLPWRLGDIASKRLLSRFAWRRKRRRHARGVLDAVMADIAARSPDHVAITGDLINFATPEEFAAARAWLEGLGDPQNVTVSPGNHDALAARGAPKGFGPWRPWLGDGAGESFPHLRFRGPVAILNLSTAVPTALHLAQGALGADQLGRAAEMLAEAGAKGFYRVALIHHPPAQGAVARRKSLTDAGRLRAVFAAVGAELILHGHAHAATLTSLPGPMGPIPTLGAPSASTPQGMKDQPARWNEIEIERRQGAWRTLVSAREVRPDLSLADLGSYEL